MKASKGYLTEIADIESFPVQLPAGQIVSLKSLFDIKIDRRFPSLFIANGQQTYRCRCFAKESFKGNRDHLKSKLMNHIGGLEGGLAGLVFSDTEREIRENMASLNQALMIATGLVFLLIVFQFSSLKWSVVVMLAIPFGVIGVGFGLWLFGSTLNVNSMLGMILLAGSTVNNSILFLDFYLRRKNDEACQPAPRY